MKLAFFRKPIRSTPLQQEASLKDFRERITTILLASAITTGALAFVVFIFPVLQAHQYGLAIVFSVCYAWILIITLLRRSFTYFVKAYSLVFLIYLLGLLNLVQTGLSADAGVFLLTFTIMAVIMIGARGGLIALLISLGTFSTAGYLISSDNLIPPLLTNYSVPPDWLSGSVVLILLSIILTLSLSTILRGLNDNIAKVKTLAYDADRDREQLVQRSQDLQRRLAQLRAAAEIEHTISAVLDPKELMQKVVDLLGERFGLYHVGIFMLDENEFSRPWMRPEGEPSDGVDVIYSNLPVTQLTLQAGIDKIIPEGYRLTYSNTSNVGWSMLNRKPRAFDISSRKDSFTATYLPLARTELDLPLFSREHVIGVLMIHSTQANAFDGDDIVLFQSAAESFTTTLENARLFQQTQADLEEIRALQRQYLSRTWADTQQILGNLSYTYQADKVKTDDPDNHDQTASTPEELSTYSTPISLREQAIGQFSLEADKSTWSNEERSFIESVITEAALTLENARLLDETQRRADHDRFIADFTRTVRTSMDIEFILSTAIRELGRNLGASEAIISLNEVAEEREQESPVDGSGQQEIAP